MALPSETLRSQLGERIPVGGTDADTMFTDAEIIDLLSYSNPELEGWRRKAAEFANLVDTTEGTSKRAMSQLHANALNQIDRLEGEIVESTVRTRSHRLSRG
jgi:hypothetical protein